MADKDRDVAPELEDEELPGDEELDEEQDEDLEAQDDTEEFEADESDDSEEAAVAGGAAVAATSRGGRFGRGKDRAASAHEKLGSVREGHERVHVDDRASAIFALICAGSLLLVLAGAWAGQFIPKNTGPTLTPLSVPTAKVVPSASASASVVPSASAAPSVSAAPSASPSAAPSASK